MKRILSFVVGAFGVALLGGCPIYSSDGGNNNCSQGACGCTAPSDCPSGSTCDSAGMCETGDCTQTGCVNGYTCTIQNGAATCVANNPTTDGGSDASKPYSGCFADTDCTSLGTGSKCLNSVCTAPINQCADATQCAANEQCVQGVCTPSCNSTTTCPTGYTCDTANGVCTGNSNPCTLGGNQCSGGTVCVQGHCDTACGPNNSCSNGLVCVNGGCMPDQKPNFVCNKEGVQDACAAGSICLRHNCYIACNPNVSTSCATADQFNICKSVTTTTGTYNVCGSATNLGSDCDPTIGKNCPGTGICIDGYCR